MRSGLGFRVRVKVQGFETKPLSVLTSGFRASSGDQAPGGGVAVFGDERDHTVTS